MDATAAVHPTDQTLRSYGLGELDLASAESVDKHLEGCAACERRVAEMTSESFIGQLRDAHGQPSSTGPFVSSLTGLSALEGGASVKAPPPADTLPPGLANHPDYEVARELGHGGMGTVYLALNRLMGRHEVLKVVSSHMMNRPGVLDRFLVEIRNAARLHHTNIVTAYSAMHIGDSVVFAMEYVEGLDLSRLVKAKGPLPVSNACNYVHQSALGLQHASELGMVHRDIKPGNLMLAKQANRAVIKVLDFGLAKVKSEGAVDGGLTHEGQMLGTPDYVAPEQISDARRADVRADIYSLGCTLYYLLTGGPPFQATSLYEILQAHHSMDALPLNLARPEVPVELAALVARMMAKEPERRFQTPKDVAQALLPFFKKGFVGIAGSKAEMSQPGAVDEGRASTRALSVPARPAPKAPPLDTLSATPRTEPTWDSLIELNAAEALEETAQAVVGSARLPRWIWPSVAVALLLALFVAWGVVVRVKTSNGVIELMNLPKDAEVFIDGEEVAVTWPGGGKPAVVSVSAGKHKVAVKKDGPEFSSGEVTVLAEGKDVFTVRFVPAAALPPVKGQADDRRAQSEVEEKNVLDGPQDPPLEAVDERDASASAVEPAATAPVAKQETPPAAPLSKPAEKMSSPPAPLVHIDEFNDPRTGLPRDPNIPHDPGHGQSDGVFFVYSPGGFHAWNIHGIRSDNTCEVVARVLSEDPRRKAAWIVIVPSKAADRGFLIKVNVRGELFLEPSPWKNAIAFRQIDPRIGPITHPAIKPGNEFNDLLLVMRKREVVIFVNGVQVCAPVKFDYDITPSKLQLGAAGPGMKRAEFDRVEIREMAKPADAPAQAAATPSVIPVAVRAAGAPKPRPTVSHNPPKPITQTIGMIFKLVPAGEFVMGSPGNDNDAAHREGPQHKVRISPFYLGVTEVTQAQYEAVMGNNPSHFSATGDGKDKVAGLSTGRYPVERVSWGDAVRFCDLLSEKEGRIRFYTYSEPNNIRTNKGPGYRLPTEAEWEYACRAGTTTRYCFGDNPSLLSEYAWFGAPAEGMTHPVGEKHPNGFGLCDMYGNVREWCFDWFDGAYHQQAPVQDPRGPSVGLTRVIRGGNFRDTPAGLRSAARSDSDPGRRGSFLGFRVALGQADR